jgi:3'-phosphoadenosine 5'-phosphosulfate sulfotransferase (PAPS reductase)/FAD synthetase
MFKKYSLKMFKNSDNATLLTGVNSLGLVSLLAYTIRTFNEVNSNMDEIKHELETLRKSHSENNKRSNLAFTHLNQKLEENTRLVSNIMSAGQRPDQKLRRKNIPVLRTEEEFEEITTEPQSNNDEITGALSALLS